jgi:putative intracellular protease/amidase
MAAKKVLIVASNYGVWAEELQAPWDILREAGHQLTLATPRGKKPLPFDVSVDPDFVDPIQNYKVNPPEVCTRTKALVAGDEWAHPIKLSDAKMADHDAIALAGGPGADLDLTNNPDVHRLILEAYGTDKLIAAICFSVGALAFTRDPAKDFKSIIYGRKVTAHPRAWDFKAEIGYNLYGATADNPGTDVKTPGFLLPMQDIVTDAVGPGGSCASDPTTSRDRPSVVFDWPFITGCSVESSIAFGRKIVDVLASR